MFLTFPKYCSFSHYKVYPEAITGFCDGWKGNKLLHNLFQHTVFKDTRCWQESVWDCLGKTGMIPQVVSSLLVCTRVSPLLYTGTTEVNQQSLSALCLSSRHSVQSSGLIWREYWQSVCSLIGFGGSDPYRCVCCAHVDPISGGAEEDWSHQSSR